MFKHIDFGYNYNLAKVAKEKGVKLFSLQSSQGSNKDSMFLYLQVKGEVGNIYICFWSLVVAVYVTVYAPWLAILQISENSIPHYTVEITPSVVSNFCYVQGGPKKKEQLWNATIWKLLIGFNSNF